jgi:glycine hydroxymethyltransferase
MRIGTAAMTTRGFKEAEMQQIADFIDSCLMNHDNDTFLHNTAKEINIWMKKYPLYA